MGNKNEQLVTRGIIPALEANQALDIFSALLKDGLPTRPHFVDPSQGCQVIGLHDDGYFTIWNPSDQELEEVDWVAEHSHSIERDPVSLSPYVERAPSVSIPSWPWGGAGGLYTNPNPTPVGHGGIPVGQTFAGLTMQQMFDAILYPVSFSSFSIQGQANPLEVGDTLPQNVSFLWSTSSPSSVQPNSIDIDDVTLALSLATGLADDGLEPVVQPGAITYNTRATHTYRISALNQLGNTFSRDANYSWVWRRFYGKSNLAGPLTEAQIEALANNPLVDGFAGNYSFPASGSPEYLYICYAATVPGAPASSFVDVSTGFSWPFQPLYTIAVTNGFGQTVNYNIHRSSNTTAGAVTIAVS